MKRFVSILALISVFCSSIAANTARQLICSHEDGQGHLVEFGEHENEHKDPCHDHHSAEAEYHEEAIACDFEAEACDDVEIPQTDLRDQGQNNDRNLVKSPAVCLSLFELRPAAIDRQIKAGTKVSKDSPALESKSRRFAKTIQIRC
ncbi:MAG: hypothetical protein HOI15_11025 [Opitutales bacterium]|nr:hypothetical protein [Opitutales bacterium]